MLETKTRPRPRLSFQILADLRTWSTEIDRLQTKRKQQMYFYLSRAGLHNIRPAGHMRPARSFLAARENSVAENVAKTRLRIITCPFRISSTLPRNRLLRPAASLRWSIWPFELSELCRPGLEITSAKFSLWMQSGHEISKRLFNYLVCHHPTEHFNWALFKTLRYYEPCPNQQERIYRFQSNYTLIIVNGSFSPDELAAAFRRLKPG